MCIRDRAKAKAMEEALNNAEGTTQKLLDLAESLKETNPDAYALLLPIAQQSQEDVAQLASIHRNTLIWSDGVLPGVLRSVGILPVG